MSKKVLLTIVILLVAITLLLAGPSAVQIPTVEVIREVTVETETQVEVTRVVEVEVEVSVEVEVPVTLTAMAPTATITPTLTSEPVEQQAPASVATETPTPTICGCGSPKDSCILPQEWGWSPEPNPVAWHLSCQSEVQPTCDTLRESCGQATATPDKE